MLADPDTEIPVTLTYAEMGRCVAFIRVAVRATYPAPEFISAAEKLTDSIYLEDGTLDGDELTEREGAEMRGELEQPYVIHSRLTGPELVGALEALLICQEIAPVEVSASGPAQRLRAKLEMYLVADGGCNLPVNATRQQLAASVFAAVAAQTNKEK